MKKTKLLIYSLILVVLSFFISIYFYPHLPIKVVSHWDFNGVPNGYSSRFWGAFLMPIVMSLILILTKIFINIDPKKTNIKKFEKNYYWFIFSLNLIFFILHIFTLLWNIGIYFSINVCMAILLPILFYVIGVLLSKAKQNYFIGIRNPWTLYSEVVWNKTHILASKLFKVLSIICLMGIFFPKYLIYLFIVPLFVILILVFVYSYLEFKKL